MQQLQDQLVARTEELQHLVFEHKRQMDLAASRADLEAAGEAMEGRRMKQRLLLKQCDEQYAVEVSGRDKLLKKNSCNAEKKAKQLIPYTGRGRECM